MRQNKRLKSKYLFIVPMFMFGFLLSAFPVNPAKVSAAACVAPTTDFGTVTSTVSIPATGAYRVWSRIQIPSSTNNSFLLEIDGNTCYTVGGNSSITLNTWMWVDYSVSTTTKINHTFATTGNHTVKMIGASDGVLLDRIIFTQDTTSSNCNPPTGTGDACATPVNVIPSVSLSASPTSGAAPLNSTLTATATDSDGTVSGVDFYRGTTLLGPGVKSTTANTWTYQLTGLAAGTYTYTAKAKDNDGAFSNLSNTVTVTASTSTTRKPGDATGEGRVDGADFSIVNNNWGLANRTFDTGDFNNSTTVDGADFSILNNNWSP